MIRRPGFTLVEVVVVIAVITILVTVTTLGLNKYVQDGRDTKRSANVFTVSEALEKYYDQKGAYPSCSEITASGSLVATNTLKGIDQSALLVPNATVGITNSIQCGTTLTINGPDFIEYMGDGSAGCLSTDSCLLYTLRYRNDATNTILELRSRRG